MNALQPPIPAAGDVGFVRNYKAWKGSNIFCVEGRLIFGPDARSLVLTIFLIVAPVFIFCVFVAKKLLLHFPLHLGLPIIIVALLLTLCDLVFLLVTSGRDPGIVPRNSQPPEPEQGHQGSSELTPAAQSPLVHLPRQKDVIVNGITVKVKYCDTCMLYRPPRCSHCSICNNCVEKFDHHCPWVGQCIGLRNYRFFYMFIFTATLLCLYIHVFCWIYVWRITVGEETKIWKAMIKTPASIALLIYSFVSFWFVGGLTVLHSYLISTNQSTNENFRFRYDHGSNPYNRGVIRNFMEVFCTAIAPSKNNFRAMVPREPGVPRRMLGRALSSPTGGKAFGGPLDSSPDVSKTYSPSIEMRGLLRQCKSYSRGRTSERSWEMSPPVILSLSRPGELRQVNDGSGH